MTGMDPVAGWVQHCAGLKHGHAKVGRNLLGGVQRRCSAVGRRWENREGYNKVTWLVVRARANISMGFQYEVHMYVLLTYGAGTLAWSWSARTWSLLTHPTSPGIPMRFAMRWMDIAAVETVLLQVKPKQKRKTNCRTPAKISPAKKSSAHI